jgi:ubiquinone/menaquinone biosynthesis C-methylase UbiE
MWAMLRKRSTRDPLSVSMAGVKLGDRVLVLGCSDPRFVAAIAAKSGLTGRTLAIDESAERAKEAEVLALREGVLIESASAPYTSLPLNPDETENDGFDLVVLRDVLRTIDPARAAGALAEAQRVTRPGGRCMVIDGAVRGGVAALFGRSPPPPASRGADEIAAALGGAGFVAVRTLAEREGLIFLEAIKRNS